MKSFFCQYNKTLKLKKKYFDDLTILSDSSIEIHLFKFNWAASLGLHIFFKQYFWPDGWVLLNE